MFSLGFCHCEQPVYLCAAILRQQVTQKMVANIRINLDIRVIWTIIYLRYHKISTNHQIIICSLSPHPACLLPSLRFEIPLHFLSYFMP